MTKITYNAWKMVAVQLIIDPLEGTETTPYAPKPRPKYNRFAVLKHGWLMSMAYRRSWVASNNPRFDNRAKQMRANNRFSSARNLLPVLV
jgi:hypothetical protein